MITTGRITTTLMATGQAILARITMVPITIGLITTGRTIGIRTASMAGAARADMNSMAQGSTDSVARAGRRGMADRNYRDQAQRWATVQAAATAEEAVAAEATFSRPSRKKFAQPKGLSPPHPGISRGGVGTGDRLLRICTSGRKPPSRHRRCGWRW